MTYYDYQSVDSCNVTLPGPSLQSMCSAAEFIVFATSLDEALRNNPIISRNCERIRPINDPLAEYDFIVAGAGAAGAVIAGRLAEIHNWKVLLIEAGYDESAAGQVPSLNELLIGSEIDWNYYTTNESHGCLSTNGSCYWSSAKSLGGNTAHNEMVYLRGNPTDYNNWYDLGNDGWSYEDVLPYFKKGEDNANLDVVASEYHSTGGPLSVGFFRYTSDLKEPFLEAAEQSGFGITKDLNGEKLIGLANVQATQKNGVRVSSATAYLQPHRDSKNLHILLGAYVTKIITEGNTAVGVQYIKDGELKTVRANKEIIVSTGVVESPKLLMLSGIGPEEHLESHGIEVVLNLPGVGGNLQTHIPYWLTFTINKNDTYTNNVKVAEEYLKYQTGPMSTIGEGYLVGTASTKRTTADYPDIQFTVSGNIAACAPGNVGALKSDEKRQIRILVSTLHSKSRGRISLASTDPLEYPVAWSNYLSEDEDVEVLVDGIEIILELVRSEALEKFNFTLLETPAEACSHYRTLSHEYWACNVHQKTAFIMHPVGTCKMGPASDPMAVVDPRLRVHGIKNLRVADASVMPQITSSNTAAPTMMIGERVADFIKDDWLPCTERF